MTTGLGKEPRTTIDERPRRRGWIWAVVAAIIAIGLIAWGLGAGRNQNDNQPAATTQSEQDSATGQQGAVGGFAGKVAPNENGTETQGMQTPPLNQQGGELPAAKTTKDARDMGAGSTGINTATDSVGGAPVHNGKQ